ncbi:biotin--[acetyl-CoA-carboxylase] ligase [Marinoscillum sp.]|uniref:biotin--[acetyl-CoA-carboxylase] ligase n=1 Tax=Marinoscillum sp. TaxID=2024838 RepID=UPI003BA9A655
MHKYFAKPLFLGKKIEFLPECHSTNEELLTRVRNGDDQEGFILYTDHQTKGKGQRGNVWLSESGQNLLFSVLLRPKKLQVKQSHFLNLIAGLAVCHVLEQHFDLHAELKWPNDVYVNDLKIAGILVETILEGSSVDDAIIGIGLNVNQSHFALPTATSIKQLVGKPTDREELLETIISTLEAQYLFLKSEAFDKILSAYYGRMRWRGEIHQFRDSEGVFDGEIIGIDDTGRLLVKTSHALKRFDVKQIEFLH